jgi:hypothetical protein
VSRPIRPDFFVVGAAKSGTTAIDHYLRAHPDVFMGPRELHFFGSDLQWGPVFKRCGRNDYLDAFSGAAEGQRVGETSPGYLYSARAAEEIKRFQPDARIIALLRSPIDMMHAFHSHGIYVGDENIKDLEKALLAEPDRKLGRHVPSTNTGIWCLCYRDAVRYPQQLRRYFDVFGRERVHVIIYDDLKNDTAAAYRDVLAFLEVDTTFQPDFEIHNPSKRPRIQTISAVQATDNLKSVGAWRVLRRSARMAIPSRRFRQRLYRWIERKNTVYERQPLSAELRERLAADVADEVRELGGMLGRDLSHWVETDRPATRHLPA